MTAMLRRGCKFQGIRILMRAGLEFSPVQFLPGVQYLPRQLVAKGGAEAAFP
jgi:hypothetical protein